MSVGVFIHWTFKVVGGGDLFKQADALTEALLEQERCTPEVKDSAVSADRAGAVVEIELTVMAASEDDALAKGQAAIRAALHATGWGTPEWPTHDEMMSLLPTNLETTPLAPA